VEARLRKYAKKRGVSLSQVVVEALRHYFEENKGGEHDD
jgi:hypothetical protein